MFCILLVNSVGYVFLLLCMLCSVYSVFILPTGTILTGVYRASFSSVVRQIPGHNSSRRGTAHTLPKLIVLFCVLFVLCCYVYCLCVNVYCTTATGWQFNGSWQIYHVLSLLILFKAGQPLRAQTSSLLKFGGHTQTHTPRSVGLLCTSDRPVAETSISQNTTHTMKQTPMLSAGIEPAIPASQRLRTRDHWDWLMALIVWVWEVEEINYRTNVKL